MERVNSGADPRWGQGGWGLNNKDLVLELEINGDLRLSNSDLREKSGSRGICPWINWLLLSTMNIVYLIYGYIF
jgi:hypothetical protein